MTRGSSQEGSQLKRTIKAGPNLGRGQMRRQGYPRKSVWEEVDQAVCQTGSTNLIGMPVISDNEQPARIKAWRDKVLAVDARKAGNASDATRLTPIPSSLTGKEA